MTTALPGTEATTAAGPIFAQAISSIVIEQTLHLVGTIVAHQPISRSDIPSLINDVHKAVKALYDGSAPAEPPAELVPAVPIKKAVTHDTITCLDCGYKGKSLKRHLMTAHELSPEQYRQRWSLPGDFVMVSPAYSEARSALAKKSGLGKKR